MTEAFGDRGWYVEELRGALDEAIDFEGPALVNVKLHHEATRKAHEFRWLTA
jgi:thiamine pyrophosphate-dependent acetolactate synthase large subunit-like protein